MSKFNARAGAVTARPGPFSPVATEPTPSGVTFEGGAGYARDIKSELFLLAVTNMVGENTFYETAKTRDARYETLVAQSTVADPEWTARLLAWLRGEGNLRSASLLGAAVFAKTRLDAGVTGMSRQVVASVLQRPDEPGEMLALWAGRYGRAIPKPVKRGVADAVQRLYTERSLLKYDSDSTRYRFADVLELVHATPSTPAQGQLFRHAIDRRHRRDNEIPSVLGMLLQRKELMDLAPPLRRSMLLADVRGLFARAGMTWEALAGWLQGPMNARAWEAIIPSMGYMSLLRNLRNFDEAGVRDEVAERVAATLADPEQVRTSRQFPFRFLSAYEAAPSLRWGQVLDTALQLSLRNLPELPGRSLILIDTSLSMMNASVSQRSKASPAKAAAVFGVALAAKGVGVRAAGPRGTEVDVVGFADRVFRHEVPKGASVIREIDRFLHRIGEVGCGTDIGHALRMSYHGHDRVFIISDMQTISGGVSDWVPHDVPIYGFNLVGYQHGAYATGTHNRHEFGGLTDATFRMIPWLENGQNAAWPWEK